MVKIFLSFRMFWYKSVCKLPIELPTKSLIKLKGYHYAKKRFRNFTNSPTAAFSWEDL